MDNNRKIINKFLIWRSILMPHKATKEIIELKLLELEAYQKGLNEYAIIVRADINGCILDVNKNLCEISGYKEE